MAMTALGGHPRAVPSSVAISTRGSAASFSCEIQNRSSRGHPYSPSSRRSTTRRSAVSATISNCSQLRSNGKPNCTPAPGSTGPQLSQVEQSERRSAKTVVIASLQVVALCQPLCVAFISLLDSQARFAIDIERTCPLTAICNTRDDRCDEITHLRTCTAMDAPTPGHGTAHPAPLVPMATVAREWTRLGVTGFGGPPTHI